MEQSNVKVGSVVKLNSDSNPTPDLFTVGSIESIGRDSDVAVLYWFDYKTKDLKSFKVHVGALTVLE